MKIFCNIINIFTATFDLFNASTVHKSVYKKIKHADPERLNNSARIKSDLYPATPQTPDLSIHVATC